MFNADEIINGCKKNSKAAQQLLYKQYATVAKGICLRYLNNISAINDVMQDGFIKVFLNINQYNGHGSFEGWLKRVMLNTALSYNKRDRRKRRLFNFFDSSNTDIEDDLQNDVNLSYDNLEGTSGYSIAELSEITEAELLAIIKKLPECYRLVFNLYSIDELNHDEIAKLLKIDTNTSRTRLLRARQFLKTELTNYCKAHNN